MHLNNTFTNIKKTGDMPNQDRSVFSYTISIIAKHQWGINCRFLNWLTIPTPASKKFIINSRKKWAVNPNNSNPNNPIPGPSFHYYKWEVICAEKE